MLFCNQVYIQRKLPDLSYDKLTDNIRIKKVIKKQIKKI